MASNARPGERLGSLMVARRSDARGAMIALIDGDAEIRPNLAALDPEATAG
jgi:hypothetical protein